MFNISLFKIVFRLQRMLIIHQWLKKAKDKIMELIVTPNAEPSSTFVNSLQYFDGNNSNNYRIGK